MFHTRLTFTIRLTLHNISYRT